MGRKLGERRVANPRNISVILNLTKNEYDNLVAYCKQHEVSISALFRDGIKHVLQP